MTSERLLTISSGDETMWLEEEREGVLELSMDDGIEFAVAINLSPVNVREMILVLQQWLATTEATR